MPEGYATDIHATLDDPTVALGSFRFSTDWAHPAMRAVEWGTHLRARVLRWPYGDQGLIMVRRMFDAVGKVPLLNIMDDFELVCRLRRCGRVVTLAATATTSARRWRHLGIGRVLLINQMMLLGYRAGVSDARLQACYRHAQAKGT